jgi:Rhomboid family
MAVAAPRREERAAVPAPLTAADAAALRADDAPARPGSGPPGLPGHEAARRPRAPGPHAVRPHPVPAQPALASQLRSPLHGSWDHILGNMLFLAIFGKNVEDAYGPLRYLVFYFAATMTQTAMTLWFGTAQDARVPSLGAIVVLPSPWRVHDRVGAGGRPCRAGAGRGSRASLPGITIQH